MSLQQAYLLEIQRETENTRRLIAGIKDEHLEYKPHEKSFSLGNLAAHIVELHNWVSLALKSNDFNFHTDYQPLQFSTADDIKKVLEDGYANNISQIENMSESEWMENWTLRAGDHIIAQMPKVGCIRYIIYNHLIHHRGQLSVYLRMNNIPVPGIYGPSADDQQG